uniref:Uncharacterized protein n=1 Tax=Salarias fasciatus TaxID=181472 RepID=A0A672I7J0_SALFA
MTTYKPKGLASLPQLDRWRTTLSLQRRTKKSKHQKRRLACSVVQDTLWICVSAHASRINSKKKRLVEYKGPKKVKVEVKATQAEDVPLPKDIISEKANELMVKETPPPTYWKEFMEERWQNLSFSVLQENEKLHETLKPKRSRFHSFRTRKRSHNGWHKSNTCLDGACLERIWWKDTHLNYRGTRHGQERGRTST